MSIKRAVFILKRPCVLMNRRRLELSPALSRVYLCLWPLPWVHTDGLFWHERPPASTWQLLHHSLCSSVIICKPMRCAVKLCCCPRGRGMEARPQGRGGRGAGQSKPLTNGKHTFLHHWNCPFYYSGGEVAGAQEGPGVQRRGMILK